MDPAEVKWTEQEYTLQGYVSKFHNSFPNIIKITEGFLGKQEIDSVSSSTVIRVHCRYTQQRVTAETKSGKLFSLPTNLTTLKFLVAQNRGSEKNRNIRLPMTLEEILSNYNLPVTVRSSQVLAYKEKGDVKSQDEMFSELTLQDTYEQNFLLGHPIDKGKIFAEDPIIVPMYMTELKLVVAMGFEDGNNERWNKICDLVTKQLKNQYSIVDATFQEIFMLDKKDLSSQELMYNTIEPIYIAISEVNNYKNTPLEIKGSCNMYETHPLQQPKQIQMYQSQQSQETAKIEPLAEKPFSTINDIPVDLHNLTVMQVSECLKLLNMNQYVEAFQTAQVDGQLVYDLNPEMMNSCLGMNGLNTVKFLKFRDGWRPNMQGLQ